ncbi:MAG: hypothetical protein RL033_338 [Pseudomonadota bacterium]
MDPSPLDPEATSSPPLTLEGALASGVASALKDAACRQLREGGDLALCCARLEQIDVSGIQVLLALRRELAEDGRRLSLQEVPLPLVRTFQLSGLLPLPEPPGEE